MRRIAIIAGEPSGDLLAARLIRALQVRCPDWVFEGIAGAEMQAAGCQTLFPLERLSIMGLVEVLKELPGLLSIRRQLLRRWRADPPDLFIGVDAPDFNLPLAAKLHAAGIPTVHYVSPSVWAWREHRVKKIQGHIDLMLTLFPFEVAFYQRHQVSAQFVGHPLADEVVFDASRMEARLALGLPSDGQILAILPGSRTSEIQQLGEVFLQVAGLVQAKYPHFHLVVPVVRPALKDRLMAMQAQVAPAVRITYLDGRSRQLMQAADYILLASGTAVLEGMLAGRLMVAAYRVSALTWWLLQTFKLLKVTYVTLPNHLAGEALVSELLQDQATPANLFVALEQLFNLPSARRQYVLQRFAGLHSQLRCNASERAADAILAQFPRLACHA